MTQSHTFRDIQHLASATRPQLLVQERIDGGRDTVQNESRPIVLNFHPNMLAVKSNEDNEKIGSGCLVFHSVFGESLM